MKNKELKKLSKKQLIFLVKHEHGHAKEALRQVQKWKSTTRFVLDNCVELIDSYKPYKPTDYVHEENDPVEFVTGRSLTLAEKWLKENEDE
jgi:hypothetical protein